MKTNRDVQNRQIVIWVKSILRIFITESKIQIREKRAKVHQKALSLMGELLRSSTLHSNFHSYYPSYLKSIHHLNPTNSRPAKFLTIQKSIAAEMTTIMRTLKGEVMNGKIRYAPTMAILRIIWTAAVMGLEDLEMTPGSMESSSGADSRLFKTNVYCFFYYLLIKLYLNHQSLLC